MGNEALLVYNPIEQMGIAIDHMLRIGRDKISLACQTINVSCCYHLVKLTFSWILVGFSENELNLMVKVTRTRFLA
jgi:hypothetical protein